MRRRCRRAVLLALLLLPALPAAARVVEVAPEKKAEQGGTPAPSAGHPMPAFGWFGLGEAEMLSRWTAGLRAAIAADRARWQAVRVAARPRFGQVPLALRQKRPR